MPSAYPHVNVGSFDGRLRALAVPDSYEYAQVKPGLLISLERCLESTIVNTFIDSPDAVLQYSRVAAGVASVARRHKPKSQQKNRPYRAKDRDTPQPVNAFLVGVLDLFLLLISRYI